MRLILELMKFCTSSWHFRTLFLRLNASAWLPVVWLQFCPLNLLENLSSMKKEVVIYNSYNSLSVCHRQLIVCDVAVPV